MSDESGQVQFRLERIFVKDMSFENPGAPECFLKKWSPEVNMEINSKARRLEGEAYEVSLEIEVKANQDKTPVFLVSVEQAGVFTVQGAEGEMLERILNTTCPSILFPYAREVVDGAVIKGSMPPLMLAPINFEALYEQQKQQKDSESKQ